MIGQGFGRRIVTGAVAGALGTAAMDLLWYRRYRHGGGGDSAWRWESAEGVTNWGQASAPGRVGEKVERLVTGHAPPDRWARPTTNLVHWATGAVWGVQYAALTGVTARHRVLAVLALGPAAWLTSYVILPLAGVYKPIWDYDARTLGRDLSAHLVFGTVTGAAYAALSQ